VAAGTDLVPHDPWPRAELQRWLSFIGTELHKAVFIPLLDKKAPDGAKAYALDNAAPRLAIVDKELAGRTYLLDRYSVADIYMVTVLNWAAATPVDLAPFSHIGAFMTRVKARPVVARCLALELEGYLAERGSAAKRPPSTRAVIDRFNDVFQRHDTSALDALVADSCVIENTDGHAYRGKSACIALWGQIADDPQVGFVLEEVETAGDRALVSWTLRKDGVPAARGVNLMRVKDGRIVHARGYAKPA
jgi:ketosteroid isomerase-like protein